MKKWGIRNRILFLATIPACGIALMLSVLFTIGGIAEMDKALTERGAAIVRQLAPASEYAVFSGNREMLKALGQSVMSETDVRAVVFFDVEDRVLMASGRPDLSQGASPNPDKSSLDFSAPIYQNEIEVGDYGEAPAQGTRGKLLGRVYIELSTAASTQRKILFIGAILLAGLCGIVGAAILALHMSEDVTRPLSRLLEAVERMANGELQTRIAADSGGELAKLEEGFNSMAERLQSGHETMQERIDEATALLAHQASHDPLTGLTNRREFEQRLKRAAADAKQHGATHVLCYLDLDQFKVVNDTCGHAAGDELLRQLSALLHEKIRPYDTLARLGGDEFGVLMEGCLPEDAQKCAEKLLETVRDFRFMWEDKVFAVGVSIGLVPVTSASGTLADILKAADSACYAAKDGGRNRIHVYQMEDSLLVRRHGEMQWISRITRAMELNRFQLYGQRIVPLGRNGGDEEYFEVLLRMVGEDGRLIPPMAFIPAAERYNTMPALDRWVVSTALAALGTLVKAGRPKKIAINLSAPSLSDPALLDFIRRELASHEISGNLVCFEITETAAIVSLGESRELMTQLKQCGCAFSLDDFGSGMSSFTYLRTLPIDFLKIDGAFVRDMTHDPVDHTIVQSINNIGRGMGLKIVAEYVENQAIVEALEKLEVHYAQGNWIEPPRPLDELVGEIVAARRNA